MALGRPLYAPTRDTRIACLRRDVERLKRRQVSSFYIEDILLDDNQDEVTFKALPAGLTLVRIAWMAACDSGGNHYLMLNFNDHLSDGDAVYDWNLAVPNQQNSTASSAANADAGGVAGIAPEQLGINWGSGEIIIPNALTAASTAPLYSGVGSFQEQGTGGGPIDVFSVGGGRLDDDGWKPLSVISLSTANPGSPPLSPSGDQLVAGSRFTLIGF